ncbi:MAG: NAD(P)-dependent oxidoreductase, partial [Chloroflexota bacterium]
VNLLPSTPETVGILNTDVFNKMKASAHLVSVGGGGVVDEPSLAHAILSAKLRGAALDTFSNEPVHPENPLLPLVRKGFNVLLTPHTAAVRTIPYNHTRDFDNIRRFLAREPLLFQVV